MLGLPIGFAQGEFFMSTGGLTIWSKVLTKVRFPPCKDRSWGAIFLDEYISGG